MQPSSTHGIRFLSSSRLVWRAGSAIVLLVLGIIGIDFLLAVYGKYRQLDAAAYAMISILLWLSWLLLLLICEGIYRIVDRASLRLNNSFRPNLLRGSA